MRSFCCASSQQCLGNVILVAITRMWKRSRKAILTHYTSSLGKKSRWKMKTCYIYSVNWRVCTEKKSTRKINSNDFIIRHLGLLASSLKQYYTLNTDFDAQYGYFHGAMWQDLSNKISTILFEAWKCFIYGHRREAVAQYRMICLILFYPYLSWQCRTVTYFCRYSSNNADVKILKQCKWFVKV